MNSSMHSHSNSKHHNGHLFNSVVVLDHLPESGDGDDSPDELFLLPESVLAMDSASFREDVASIAPSFHFGNSCGNSNVSPHNSLDSSDSSKSLKLLEDSDGLRLARASNGCKTLWLCKFYMKMLHLFLLSERCIPGHR